MPRTSVEDLIPMLAQLHAASYEARRSGLKESPVRVRRPFVTISRQTGAGGRTLARALVARLNELDRGSIPWTVWDNELVEKVAAEHRLPAASVAALEDTRPSWFEEALAGLTLGDWREHPDELAVYQRVARTVRALAEIGRVVIVGRGGVFITRDLPDGVHLRLVAPLEYRIMQTLRTMGPSATRQAAEIHVRNIDQSREDFYRRYWPHRPIVVENFTATFNSAVVPAQRLIDAIVPLILDTRVERASDPASRPAAEMGAGG